MSPVFTTLLELVLSASTDIKYICDVNGFVCYQAVTESLSIGAPLLLPPLQERMELLHTLLPQGPEGWDSLSRGQVGIYVMCTF